MILNGIMFNFSVPTPGDHRSPLRTDGVSCAKSKPIKVNLNAKSQFVELFAFSIFKKMTIRNTAPFVGQADPSLPSAKRQTAKDTN